MHMIELYKILFQYTPDPVENTSKTFPDRINKVTEYSSVSVGEVRMLVHRFAGQLYAQFLENLNIHIREHD